MRELIITSSILILALMLMRRIFRSKISRRLQYALWLLAAVRLLVPAQLLTSYYSVMNVVAYIEETVDTAEQEIKQENNTLQQEVSDTDSETLDAETDSEADSQYEHVVSGQGENQTIAETSENRNTSDTAAVTRTAKHTELFKMILLGIYIAGVCIVGGCIVLCNMKFYKRLCADRKWLGQERGLNVYVTSQIQSPCLFGIWTPSIYMTENALYPLERKNYIILHEATHYRHLDHIWAVVRSLCLTLYWFHPLVWVAAGLSMEDSELACDEGTLNRLSAEERKAYGCTLIEMTAEQARSSRFLYCATGMTGGKRALKERIKAIANDKKKLIWITMGVLVIAAMLAVFTTGGREKDRHYWIKNGTVVFTAMVINDITDKYYTDDYYLTIELDDAFVECYQLPIKEVTLPAEKSVYDEVDLEYRYIGFNIESFHKKKEVNEYDLAVLFMQNDAKDFIRIVGVSEGNGKKTQKPEPYREAGIIVNADGSFRMSEYKVDLTGDKIKERIVFDVSYGEELGADGKMITNAMLWEKLWDKDTDISVKVLEGREEGAAEEDTVLAEFSYDRERAESGNLAVVRYENQWCIMQYGNAYQNDMGNFGYEIWQIMPSGEEAVRLEEMSVIYKNPENGGNSEETIQRAIQIEGDLNRHLHRQTTEILINASLSDAEYCYMYGLTGSRYQDAFEVFMAEAGGKGYELKIVDYFYPNGMEPAKSLPEDAEERILNGEILFMEVSPDNTTAGRLDLDGDGEKEVLYLDAVRRNAFDNRWEMHKREDTDLRYYISRCGYRIRVNDVYCDGSYCSTLDGLLMAFSPDGKQILLAVFDAGPSGDPQTYFYKYDDTGVHPAGMIYDDLRDTTIEDGFIKASFRMDMFQTEWAWGYYYWNGSEIVRREDEIYDYVDSYQWRENNEMPLVLLKEITVYEERSETSRAFTMKPQKVRTVATDLSAWILFEAEDGTRGWLPVEPYGYFPTAETDQCGLFEGLNMAG